MMTRDAEYDADGLAVPGTYPISTVSLGAWGDGGKPIPNTESAICDVCGDWASGVWSAGTATTADDSFTDMRVSRRVTVVVYACPEHSEQVLDALVDEYGGASNDYRVDDLAAAVVAMRRQGCLDRYYETHRPSAT